MSSILTDLIKVSRRYGGDPDWLLEGGGNTSMKDNGTLFVKASGFSLADIEEQGFVKMSMKRLSGIWQKNYPADETEREAEVLKDMMASRLDGETARPSVEALLHSLIRGRYVVHTHPALVNGLTSGLEGERILSGLFGERALWVPETYPGYILANDIRSRLEQRAAEGKAYPHLLFLQNHGLFASADTADGIDELHADVEKVLRAELKREPVKEACPADEGEFKAAAAEIWGEGQNVSSAVNSDILDFAASDGAFEAVRLPFNPDQIVYAGPGPVRADSVKQLPEAVEAYRKQWKCEPRAVFLKGSGLFTAGATEKKASAALSLMFDSLKIAIYAESFGGIKPMRNELIVFIRDWEVERFRAGVSSGK